MAGTAMLRETAMLRGWPCSIFSKEITMTRLGAGGEEWRSMGDGAKGYDPKAAESIVASARQRIEQVRKRDVRLKIVDRSGKPVARKTFQLVQTRLDFPFGDQMWQLDRLYRFNRQDTDAGRYWKLRFAELFNAANALCYWTERPRNDGPKTEDIQGFPQMDGFHYCVDWAASQGLTVKGHPIFWSIDKAVPDWVKRYPYETQLKFLEVRVRSLVASVRGRVKIWDVVNEPLWEPAFRNLPQRNWPHIEPVAAMADYIEPVIGWARQEDPDACYVLNDYGLEHDSPRGEPLRSADGTLVTAALQRRRMLELLEELAMRKSSPGALGLQTHTGGWQDHASQLAVYDELSAAGLPIHITEFWASTEDLRRRGLPQAEIDEIQAQFVVNYITCAFSHPVVEAFFCWGLFGHAVEFNAKHSGHELGLVYQRVHDLLHNQWRTRTSVATDADGMTGFRGFLGDYSLRYNLREDQPHGARFTVDNSTSDAPVKVVAALANG
jgi:GH35 family endo-1,4-beta-xylanase